MEKELLKEFYARLSTRINNDFLGKTLALTAVEGSVNDATAYVKSMVGEAPTSTNIIVVFALLISKPEMFQTIKNPTQMVGVISVILGLGILYERLKNAETH